MVAARALVARGGRSDARGRAVGTSVLSLGPGVQIVLATAPVDLRRGHDGLVSPVQSLWKADPYSGTLFVFFGRRMARVKILFFSAGGFVVYCIRSANHVVRCPAIGRGLSRACRA
ncbi:MAG: hypothetical protein BGO98_06515 [Myxococcales bacterium 68-20]|nr:MAG: hypothetical protein BGO98_06515 [Myxococcales bacterium 68-20]